MAGSGSITCGYGPTSSAPSGRVWTQVPAFIGDARPLVEHAELSPPPGVTYLDTATAEAKET